eukprot:CAMPEP_0171104174 /NCGR_PEP_ID=MMETSP0766_2-20121228/60158_1 /TAXON_ID=439317 /ORGANISM="Gambierdiscus australes, Strain CAWD 149" /LENGTH=147 /DNA_ID=CAMNT_0011564749 /DNA_START=92 /DNA_END=535 /DNA_ORIENTATION=+
MSRVGLGRHGLHDDRHEAVERATELRALAVEDALALDEGVDAVDAPGGRIRLDAQRRHREAVEHVLPCDEEADVRACGHRQALVDLQIAVHARLQVLVGHKIALELVEGGDFSTLKVLLRRGVVLSLDILQPGLALLLGPQTLQGWA